jgi:hypothetical protein
MPGFTSWRRDLSAESHYESEQQRSNCALDLSSPVSQQIAKLENKPRNHRSTKGDPAMRFMVMVKATAESEKEGARPDPQLMAEMGKYNGELMKAGVLLALDGLHPSSKGARVKFSGKSRTVIDGPFTEAKELVAGFWMLQVKSLEEAIEWVKRCPNCHAGDSEIEIRQVFEMEEFAPILSEEQIQHKVRVRAELPNQTRENSRTRTTDQKLV